MIRSPAGFDGFDRIKRYQDYYQAGYGVMMLSAGQFSPLSLFSAGEQGVWYDPSDFSTMFQDSAGTTPVTAVEQPVGLLLDKSKGLASTANINFPSFASTSGWTTANMTVALVGDAIVATNVGAFYGHAGRPITTVANTWYKVTCTVNRGTSSIIYAYARNTNFAGAALGGLNVTAAGDQTVTYYFMAASSASYIDFGTEVIDGAYITIESIVVSAIAGNHASQATAASRPLLKQDGNGKYYLLFDGSNDSLATGTINPGAVNQTQVFAGVRKLSDAIGAVVAETSVSGSVNAGSFTLLAPNVGADYFFRSRGSLTSTGVTSPLSYASPITNVLTGISNISGNSIILRINGVQVGTNTADQGTGNVGSYPLYIGRRAGSILPFNGNLYSFIARFSANGLSTAQIASTETWVNGKTGAY